MQAWIANAEALIRAAFPQDFETRPIYIVPRQELDCVDTAGFDASSECLGYTSTALDVRLQPHLEGLGRWQGRGFATVIYEGLHRKPLMSLGQIDFALQRTVLHELCHHFESPDHPARRQPANKLTKLRGRGPMAGWTQNDRLLMQYVDSFPHLLHSSRFVRAAIHVTHRLRAIGCELYPWDLVLGSGRYDVGRGFAYSVALADEPARRQTESLFDVLADDPPAAFADCAEQDRQRMIEYAMAEGRIENAVD